MDRTEKTSALPDLSRQATGANDPIKEELQTSSLANAPAMDRSEQLVLENPELATFREGDTWVIDKPRLSSFLAKAQVSLSAEGNPPTADTLFFI